MRIRSPDALSVAANRWHTAAGLFTEEQRACLCAEDTAVRRSEGVR